MCVDAPMSLLWESASEDGSDAPMDVRVWLEERLNRPTRGGSHHDPYAAGCEGRILFSGRVGNVAVHLRDCNIGSSSATGSLV
jgi:hypothetical protein